MEMIVIDGYCIRRDDIRCFHNADVDEEGRPVLTIYTSYGAKHKIPDPDGFWYNGLKNTLIQRKVGRVR